MEYRFCSNKTCGIEKELTEDNFYFRNDSGKFRNECIDCFNEADKPKRKKSKDIVIDNIINRICIACDDAKQLNSDNFYFKKKSGKFTITCIVCRCKKNKQDRIDNPQKYKKRPSTRKKKIITFSSNGLETRICKNCKFEKEILTNFKKSSKKETGEGFYYEKICLECKAETIAEQIIRHKEYNKNYYIENKGEFKIYRKEYVKNNIEKVAAAQKNHYENNKEKRKLNQKEYYKENTNHYKKYNKEYRDKNKEILAIKDKEYKKQRRIKEPFFKLRSDIASVIRQCLLRKNIKKGGKSITKYLGYSMLELKTHIESLFEPWMTWENRGIYKPKLWNDNDQSTWVWQLDHILPQVDFPYTSMEDDNFKKCWALTNLRPLSAKENLTLGIEVRKRIIRDKKNAV